MSNASLIDYARAERGPELLVAHHEALERFETLAERYVAQGSLDDAVATAGVAATIAGHNHPGVFASPRLEAVLARAAHELPPLRRRQEPSGPEQVLIVVTELYRTGGHTRQIWRWIARDPSRVYSVVSTLKSASFPEGLRAAVSASGGSFVELGRELPPMQRAASVRALCAEADMVVLFDHHYDPIPATALGSSPARPPVVMMNHGDHMFWLGRDIVDVLMCTREVGVTISARRGFPSSRVVKAPMPVSGPDGSGSAPVGPLDADTKLRARAELLDRFGWPPHVLLMVSVGAPYKFKGVPGIEFLDFVGPVLESTPDVCLLVVGADHDARWERLASRTGGRAVALGLQPEGVGQILAAADLYVESRPFGGPTASSEAAAHGLPVLSGAATALELELFATDAGYGAIREVGSVAYDTHLRSLISDPELRFRVGDEARLVATATDADWPAAVESLYAKARAVGRTDAAEFSPLPASGDVDLLVDVALPARFRHELDAIHANLLTRELIARRPVARQLLGTLEDLWPVRLASAAVAFSAPPPDAESLLAVVTEFRLLHGLGLAAKFMIALQPDAVDAAVPVLEAAVSQPPEIDVELVVNPDPEAQRPEGALEVAVGRPPGESVGAATSL